MLHFILLIRHQQNPFKDVKCASSEKIMKLFYGLKKHCQNDKAN